MKIRFYIDPETSLPHVYKHGVDESEVEDVLKSAYLKNCWRLTNERPDC